LEGVAILVIDDPEYQRYMRRLGAVAVMPSELQREIHLMPEAFASVEVLARTLGHERNHVAQLELYGSPDTAMCELWEEASKLVEGQYVPISEGASMSSAVPRRSGPAATQRQSPVLVVDNAYRTPVRPGVLLVAQLRAGNVRPGERLEAELPNGGHLEVVVQAVDSMTEGDRGERTVGLLLAPTDASKLAPGTILTSPYGKRELRESEEPRVGIRATSRSP